MWVKEIYIFRLKKYTFHIVYWKKFLSEKPIGCALIRLVRIKESENKRLDNKSKGKTSEIKNKIANPACSRNMSGQENKKINLKH